MIDERLYSIGPELYKKLEEIKKYKFAEKATMENVIRSKVNRHKPFYDFHLYCKHGYEQSPYNPENQAKFRVVYDRDDTLNKEEFEELRKIDKVKYVLYHQWKNGDVTEEQLRNIKWFELLFPNG